MSSFNRVLAFFSKWVAEVGREPALMLSLVVGPFLVLLAFGEGVDIGGPRPRTIVVQQPGSDEAIQPLPDELNQHIDVVGQTTNLDEARAKLRDDEADAVAVVPPDPLEYVKRGQQVAIHILTNEIDPVRKSYAKAYLADQVATLNQKTIAKAVSQAQQSLAEVQRLVQQARPLLDALGSAQGDLQRARDEVRQVRDTLDPLATAADRAATAARGAAFVVPGLSSASDQAQRLQALVQDLQGSVAGLDQRLNAPAGQSNIPGPEEIQRIQGQLDEVDALANDARTISPDVLSAPFKLELENVAPFVPTFAGFYAPAVLVLLLQHLAITLGALSLARVRLIGLVDLLRVSPVRATEVVVGNYLAYGALCLVAGAGLIGFVIGVLGVPVFGSWSLVIAGVLALVVSSLGIGFIVATLSRSEQQAAQLSMLILLGSIFFSGFVFSLDRILWPVRAISYVLPSTYAIRVMQDVMLRGVLRHPEDFVVLGATAAVFFAATVLLFRREFRPT